MMYDPDIGGPWAINAARWLCVKDGHTEPVEPEDYEGAKETW